MATVTLPKRDPRGRYAKKNAVRKKRIRSSIQIEHNYCVGSVCDGNECRDDLCAMHPPLKSKNIRADGWKFGRRVVELDVLLSSLKYCRACRLGPVPLTYYNVVGEMKRGLGGYIYVKCQNVDCGEINCVPYGKTHRLKKSKPGMPCFAVNTKLGTGNRLLRLYNLSVSNPPSNNAPVICNPPGPPKKKLTE